jgi:hypothetical protein
MARFHLLAPRTPTRCFEPTIIAQLGFDLLAAL